LTSPTLFTSPVSIQVIGKMRNDINRGILPTASDMVDDFAIAQLLLSFFVEMPEPILPNDLYSEFYSYHRSQAAVKIGSQADSSSSESCAKLKAILAKLPIENAVTLRYLLKLLHVWENESGEKKVILPLLQQIMMRPPENQSSSTISSDVLETISYHIYTMVDDLDLPTDTEALKTYERPVLTVETKPIPVTLFSPEVKREILESAANERPLSDLDAQGSAQPRRAIVPRNKGTSGAEGSSSGRSACSD